MTAAERADYWEKKDEAARVQAGAHDGAPGGAARRGRTAHSGKPVRRTSAFAEFAPSVHRFPPQENLSTTRASPGAQSHRLPYPPQERELHRQRREKERHDREVDIPFGNILDRMVRQVEKDDIRGDDGRVFRDSRCFQMGRSSPACRPLRGNGGTFCTACAASRAPTSSARRRRTASSCRTRCSRTRSSRRCAHTASSGARTRRRGARWRWRRKAAKEAREAKDHMRLLQAGLDGDTLRHRLQSAGHMCTTSTRAPPRRWRREGVAVREGRGLGRAAEQRPCDVGSDPGAAGGPPADGNSAAARRGARPMGGGCRVWAWAWRPSPGEGTIGGTAPATWRRRTTFVYPSGGDGRWRCRLHPGSSMLARRAPTSLRRWPPLGAAYRVRQRLVEDSYRAHGAAPPRECRRSPGRAAARRVPAVRG